MDCLQCAVTPPAIIPICDRVVLSGGGQGLIFMLCATDDLTDPTDPTEYATKKYAGQLFHTPFGHIIGSIPEAEAGAKKIDSCVPDEIMSRTHTWEITDFNAEDLTLGFTQDDFYNNINSNYRKYQVGFVTCDERIYGFVKRFSFNARRVVEDNNQDGTTHWMATITFQDFDHIVPVHVPGIVAALDI